MSSALNKILCIDDEEDILEVAQLSLEAIGNYTVQTCNDPLQSLQTAEAFRPDLIMLDVMMPVMDGPATLKLLQENANTASIPVVFMTARVQPSEIGEYLSLGVSGVIAKPFDPMTLSEQIKTLWESFHAKK